MSRNHLTCFVLGMLLLGACCGCGSKGEAKAYPTKHAVSRGNAARAAPYVASIKAEPYHRPGCAHAKRTDTDDLVGYPSCAAAEKDGHRPCITCQP